MVRMQNNLKQQSVFGKQVEFISITVDPKHDTAPVLLHYGDEYGVDGQGWQFLTGSTASIANTLKHYGVYAKQIGSNEFIHTTAEFLVDAHGDIRQIYGADISVPDSEKDIESLLQSE